MSGRHDPHDRSDRHDPGGRPLLEVEGLTTLLPTSRGVVHAVEDVSVSLLAGETLGVVGESGSGKSVLARSIMRLTPDQAVTTGAVRFDGRDLLRMGAAEARSIWGRQIAMVFQNPMTALNPVVRVGRQVTESLVLHLGLSRAEARARAVELLGSVGIPDPERRIDVHPHQLSGGMRQRVCIAVAIACSPRLLLADEPTTALDVTIQRQILDLLGDLQRSSGMSMVLITHDLGVVAGRAARVVVMYGGRVVESGPTAAIFHDARHPYTAALLAASPRLDQPPHTRLATIPGRPVQVIDPGPGCRFAPRCPRAQERCRHETPPLVPGSSDGHAFACFHPVAPSAGDGVRVGVAAGGGSDSEGGSASP